jgi:hypothetical protein
MNNIYRELSRIQKELKAPKNQRNTFANFNYRSCEDILEAVKPLLGNLSLTLSDKVECVGNHNYVCSTAFLSDDEGSIAVSAYAREAEEQKGMNSAQITGSTSSYARKYALNGLFAIDDTKDADTQDNREVKKSKLSDTVRKQLFAELGNRGFSTDEKRHALLFSKFGVSSSKDLTDSQAKALIKAFKGLDK